MSEWALAWHRVGRAWGRARGGARVVETGRAWGRAERWGCPHQHHRAWEWGGGWTGGCAWHPPSDQKV